MSRIAGFFSRSPHSSAVTGRMLHFMAMPGAKPQVAAIATGAVGWIGSGFGGVAQEGALSVCLDGVIFNRDELRSMGSAGDSDAMLLLRLVAKCGLVASLASINGDFAVAV